MPLPDRSVEWPPKALQTVTAAQTTWDAWYRGDPASLQAAYQGRSDRPANRPSQYRGGLVGTVARWFWGTPNGSTDEPRIRLHVPLAADICQASADLLFADPPALTGTDDATSARLQEYIDDGLPGILSHGAEICAALGGTFLRATWDPDLQRRPFLTTVDADAAWPEFRWGRLSAVTFWWRIASDGSTVWRHLERHEIAAGVGVVEHGLYVGTDGHLGRRVPLAERPETAALAVNADSVISTGSPGLDVAYVPNLKPQRLWRGDPVGTNLGRGDLDGVESLMDALDRVYSSWMRDVDLGKGRITVPEYMLEVGKPGQGVTFDLDREVYQGINVPPNSGVAPVVSQFSIRVAEHQATAQQLVEDILRACGYSAQTFGEDEGSGAATATEIVARDRRSMLTRDRKIRLWQPAIQDMAAKMLAIDRDIFGARVNPDGVRVKFSNSSQDTPLQLAQTAQAMSAAQAASTRTKVLLLHPDWTDDMVTEEVARIHGELGIGGLADPTTVGVPNDSVPPAADSVAF